MLRNGIAQFVGSWVSQSGYRLRVEKVRRDRAVVDFLDPRGAPIVRPYMGGAPSMKMIAHYDDYNEDFRVDLWEESKGFILHLDHEYGYVLDPEQREALVPAISRYERDRFLDAYYSLFGPLDHFVRTTAGRRGCRCKRAQICTLLCYCRWLPTLPSSPERHTWFSCSAQENTSDKTVACAACFAGVIFLWCATA